MLLSKMTGHLSWLVLGVLAGVGVATLIPSQPLAAVSTDRQENFAICTGPADENVECLFLLDFLTGELKCTAVSHITGKFNAYFMRNIVADLKIDQAKNPRYVMVTGLVNLRRQSGSGQVQPGACVLYVAELTTGKVAVYAVPWNRGASNSNFNQQNALVLLDVWGFRDVAIRESK